MTGQEREVLKGKWQHLLYRSEKNKEEMGKIGLEEMV